MKQLIIVLSILFFASCSTAPDNIMHAQKSEKGNWVYDSVFKKPIQEDIEYVQIAPTWGQAFDYASKRADRELYVGLAVLLLAMAVFLVISKAKDASWVPRFFDNVHIFNMSLFLLISFSASSFLAHPGGIRFNNDKWVNKLDYDKVIKESGSTQPIWDSLETNCLIVDGPYNCYK